MFVVVFCFLLIVVGTLLYFEIITPVREKTQKHCNDGEKSKEEVCRETQKKGGNHKRMKNENRRKDAEKNKVKDIYDVEMGSMEMGLIMMELLLA